jgi:hypothetical protein
VLGAAERGGLAEELGAVLCGKEACDDRVHGSSFGTAGRDDAAWATGFSVLSPYRVARRWNRQVSRYRSMPAVDPATG